MSNAGIGRHGAGEQLPRHRHVEGYVAVVLAGGYVEAGDDGRLAAAPGTVLVHGAYAAHQDRFGARGAEVLNLPAIPGLSAGMGRIADPDAVVRLVERDPRAAAALVREQFVPAFSALEDWPDLLAAALRGDPALALAGWADAAGLDPASVSRGFVRAYGISPKRFRLEARARKAIRALPGWRHSLAALAADTGFADQAHLARTLRSITGHSPAELRAKSVQAASIAAL
jgi:AraC-like DNA-binding protein